MKRVLIIGTMNIYGGVGHIIFEFLKNIDKREVQFDFLYYEDIGEKEKELIKKYGGNFYMIPRYSKNPILFYKEIRKFYEKHSYDIVHIHASTAMLIIYVLPILGLNMTKIIYQSHTDSIEGMGNYILHSLFKKVVKKYSNIKIAVSESAAKYMFDTIDSSEIIILKNGISIEKFKFLEDVRQKIRNDLKLQDEFLIGHIGRFTYSKNQRFIVEVFEEIVKYETNVSLLLVGRGEDEGLIKKIVAEKKLSNKVIFYGTSDNVEELLGAMDCFIFPSNYEGLGIVALEAQASGLPVVASTNVPKEAKISELFISLSLTEDSIETWAKKILEIKGNIVDRKYINEQVKTSGYDITDVSKRLEDIYIKGE